MYGAVIGDVVGSVYEFAPVKTKDFDLIRPDSRFTDDTVLTIATIDALLKGKSYATVYKEWYKKYPQAGYGASFCKWAQAEGNAPYYSWGNGSAMRVSPIGWYFETLAEVLNEAQKSAKATHNHPEGIKGAQAVAAAIYLARSGQTKEQIKEYIERTFDYKLDEPLVGIRTWYKFDVSCQGSVPQAIIAFLEAESFEDALRNAISLGGDSDTLACISGAIAEAYFRQIPVFLKTEVMARLDSEMTTLLNDFYKIRTISS
ncbi:MAG: ADP-ribosylglycohydrolase family protein [Peptococcaceae bacterium]|jgi:ADP-ribosylglycohydrolase|nr:ADP-ribosylglycohydrolase family protein [Peptococcaceae bacterium]